MKILSFLLTFAVATSSVSAHNYFVAPAGNDASDGSVTKPFATFGRAQSLAQPGDTVFFRGGVYRIGSDQIQKRDRNYATVYNITNPGLPDRPIVYTGYGDERAVFDMSEVDGDGLRLTGILLGADNIVMRQIDVTGLRVLQKGHSQSECLKIKNASNCRLENMAFHDGMAIGVYLLEGKNNLIVNCDAYNNYDNYSEGEYGGNTDGFGAHLGSPGSTGNVFRNCRAWWNSDDGFDLINCIAPVTIENCVAFYNGFRPGTLFPAGDGTGFKAGGFGMKPESKMVRKVVDAPRHVVRNSIAYRNRNKGIYSNHHLGGVDFIGNISIANPLNYTMLCRKSPAEAVDVPGYGHNVIDNISVSPLVSGKHFTDYDAAKTTFKDNVTIEGSAADAMLRYFNPVDYLGPRDRDGSLGFDVMKLRR